MHGNGVGYLTGVCALSYALIFLRFPFSKSLYVLSPTIDSPMTSMFSLCDIMQGMFLRIVSCSCVLRFSSVF